MQVDTSRDVDLNQVVLHRHKFVPCLCITKRMLGLGRIGKPNLGMHPNADPAVQHVSLGCRRHASLAVS